jgi:hypothetical protein
MDYIHLNPARAKLVGGQDAKGVMAKVTVVGHGAPGSDVRKVAIALKIRQTTTVRMECINDMLKMKSAANVRQQIWRMNTEKSDLNKLNKQAKDWLKI